MTSTRSSRFSIKHALLVAFVGIPLALFVSLRVLADPRPTGEPGAEAEALARAMLVAIDDDAWQRTGAVRWSFGGKRDHLWDRQRQLARVQWKGVEVLVNLQTQEGKAWRKGKEVSGGKAEKLVRKAYEAWINDSFWLNPVSKIFDEGTERSVVPQDEGLRGLLVEYTSGGVTPGDAYLWIVGDDGLPVAWKMWTSNIPFGGAKATWEGWTTLDTGAKISTEHDVAVIGQLPIGNLAGAADLATLEPGDDPFAPLLNGG